MNRACQLIEELGAGEVVDGVVDIYPEKREEHDILFSAERVNDLLGTDLTLDEMLTYFGPLELKYNPETKMVTVPTFRQDLEGQADLGRRGCPFLRL